MSRFDFDGDGEGMMPWELWESVVSRALGGRKGQEALAAMEAALVALPEPRLIYGHLALEGEVCAVGAYVAHRQAAEAGVNIEEIVAAMGRGILCWCGHARDAHADGACGGKWDQRACQCEEYVPDEDEDGIYATVDAGRAAGLPHTIAWHLAYLNDEQFAAATPEQRHEKMLAFVRRAQGKPVAAGGGRGTP